MHMKKWIILASVVFVLSACNKKSDPTPETATQLISRAWVLSAFTSTDPNFQVSGQVLIGSEWTFRSDKSFELKAVMSSMNVTFNGTWSLSADNKVLTLGYDNGGSPITSEMTISTLTTSQLVLGESIPGMSNTYTFVPKP